MIDIVRSGKHKIEVLHRDNHLLVAVKPPNLPSQADSSGDDDMLSALKRYVGEVYQKPGKVYLGLVHRLDRPVGGVMAFARTSKAAARLSAEFAGGGADKRYLAVVRGEVVGALELNDYLVKDADTGMVRIAGEGEPGAKPARLQSVPLASRGGLTLMDVRLYTGRPHQIRVQHLGAGHPIWGDNRYGGGRPGEQIALWAYYLALHHPVGREPMEFIRMPQVEGGFAAFGDEISGLMSGHGGGE